MNLDFLNKEISLSGNKKDTYPTKKTINLYFKEDKTTRPTTIALYIMFFLVVGVLAAKILVVDLATELEKAERQMDAKYAYLEEQMTLLGDYSDISSKYSRYSSSYLREDEKLIDRMEIIDMLEKTVFLYSSEESVVITGDVVSVTFNGATLEESANIVSMIENYPMVSHTEVNMAALDEGYSTHIMITLVSEETQEESNGEAAGGEQ